MTEGLPQAIVFDLDDTLIEFERHADPSWQAVAAMAADRVKAFDAGRFHIRIGVRQKAFWSDQARAQHGRMDRSWIQSVVTEALGDIGIADEELTRWLIQEYDRIRTQAIRLVPGAVDLLTRLQGQGVRLGLLTNGATEAQRPKIERFDLTRYFDAICIESEVGYGKPDRQAFTNVLTSLDTPAEDAWMVGDRLATDVAPAMDLGMHGVWVDWARAGLPPHPPAQPHSIVTSVAEIATPLRQR